MSHNETESIQRALNDAKKRELEEKYGGTFHSSDPNLPPDIEADWLRIQPRHKRNQGFDSSGADK